MKLNPKIQTIRDHVSDDILKEFLNQLPWEKDQLFTTNFPEIDSPHKTKGVYRDVVKLEKIQEATIKIKKGTMSGRFFVEMLKELPRFDFDKHHYQLWLSNFTRETIPVKKHINKWPSFHVRKIISKVKELA